MEIEQVRGEILVMLDDIDRLLKRVPADQKTDIIAALAALRATVAV